MYIIFRRFSFNKLLLSIPCFGFHSPESVVCVFALLCGLNAFCVRKRMHDKIEWKWIEEDVPLKG